jgi:hypothetical protein
VIDVLQIALDWCGGIRPLHGETERGDVVGDRD